LSKNGKTDEKVRIGIVGSKFAAGFHADSYKRHEHTEIVAVAAIDNLEEFSRQWDIPRTYEDYHEMMAKEDIDLVSVCVPNFLHKDVVLTAAKYGKNVLCEKPLATNAQDANLMVEACKKAGVKLFYAEDWVFSPSLHRVEQIIKKDNGIGQVLYIKAKETHNGTHSPFAKNKDTCGGGCLIHLGIHPIGWALHFLGQEGRNKVVEVIGKVNGGGEDNYVHKDNTGEDWGLGVLKFANGEHALVEGNYITVGGMDDKIEIYGTEGVVKVDLTFGSNIDVYSRQGYGYAIEKADNTLGWTKPAVDEFYNLGYVDELAYAVDCVRNDLEPMYGCSGKLGAACNSIIEALYESSRTGQVIKGEWG
jgi:predicted dehydrogenase